MVTQPTTRERRSREEARKRNEILDVAERVFLDDGYFLATTDEIARESGYSVGTLYNYFDQKATLYVQVLERIVRDLCEEVQRELSSADNLVAAVEALVSIRIRRRDRYRVFLQAQSYGEARVMPFATEGAAREVAALSDRYIGVVSESLRGTLSEQHSESALHLALGLEGAITAFIGYCARPDTRESVENIVDYLSQTFLRAMNSAADPTGGTAGATRREIHISHFDYTRLEEVLRVARWFADPTKQDYLEQLEKALRFARVVSPKEVPPNLVTLNSRIVLADQRTGNTFIRTLVFPSDADESAGKISVLEPLGTALLGARVGEMIRAIEPDGSSRYKLESILYQPEAMGDFHL